MLLFFIFLKTVLVIPKEIGIGKNFLPILFLSKILLKFFSLTKVFNKKKLYDTNLENQKIDLH